MYKRHCSCNGNNRKTDDGIRYCFYSCKRKYEKLSERTDTPRMYLFVCVLIVLIERFNNARRDPTRSVNLAYTTPSECRGSVRNPAEEIHHLDEKTLNTRFYNVALHTCSLRMCTTLECVCSDRTVGNRTRSTEAIYLCIPIVAYLWNIFFF